MAEDSRASLTPIERAQRSIDRLLMTSSATSKFVCSNKHVTYSTSVTLGLPCTHNVGTYGHKKCGRIATPQFPRVDTAFFQCSNCSIAYFRENSTATKKISCADCKQSNAPRGVLSEEQTVFMKTLVAIKLMEQELEMFIHDPDAQEIERIEHMYKITHPMCCTRCHATVYMVNPARGTECKICHGFLAPVARGEVFDHALFSCWSCGMHFFLRDSNIANGEPCKRCEKVVHPRAVVSLDTARAWLAAHLNIVAREREDARRDDDARYEATRAAAESERRQEATQRFLVSAAAAAASSTHMSPTLPGPSELPANYRGRDTDQRLQNRTFVTIH